MQYLHRDHLGSIVATTNAAGTIRQRWEYEPYGLRWRTAGASPDDTERGYTGHEQLDAVDLIHMNGRVQDPTLGRFISADPFVQAPYHSESLNRYSYVWNNPTTFTDPSGFDTTLVDMQDPAFHPPPHGRPPAGIPIAGGSFPANWHPGIAAGYEIAAYEAAVANGLAPPIDLPVVTPGANSVPQGGTDGASATPGAGVSPLGALGWYLAGAFDDWFNDALSESVIPIAPVQAFGRPPTNGAELAYDLGPTLPWLAAGTTWRIAGKVDDVARTIPWSSKAVRDATKALQNGATDVRVASRSQAEELFLGRYHGSGYRNTTGMSPREAKDFHGGKAGTYHWDTGPGAYPHGSSHLQIHTHEGQVVRIFFPD